LSTYKDQGSKLVFTNHVVEVDCVQFKALKMNGFGGVLTLFEKTEIMNLIKYFFEVNTIFLTLMTLLSTNCVSLSTRYLSNCTIEISL
jgi:flagellar biosynthesis protein FlhB